MKNLVLESKVVKSIEENLDESHDNKGVGVLVEDSVAVSVGQLYEDDGSVRDLTRDEVLEVGFGKISRTATLSGLLSILTTEEKTALYTGKASDVELQIFYDEHLSSSFNLHENTILIDKGILTQDRLDEITKYTEFLNKLKGIEEETTTAE